MGKKIGIIGSGQVATVLADGFLKYGHEVTLGTRDPARLADWKAKTGGRGAVASMSEAAKFGEIVVLSVKGTQAEAALDVAGAANLTGKTVIDVNNPIAEAAPIHGVLQYFTGPNESLMERLQKKVPAANFVKAFSCVGNAFMVNPQFPGGKPSMFICGNNDAAKADVRAILDQFGWETEDMGAVEAARAIEPLCMLWCIPGMSGKGWNHAFKLLRT